MNKRIASPGPDDMTPEELRSWRQAMGYTQIQAAANLHASRRGYQQWENGEAAIPGHLPLACMAVSMGLAWARDYTDEPPVLRIPANRES